jgi:hypothetical protein
MIAYPTNKHRCSVMACVYCGNVLIAPDLSRYVNEYQIQSEWFCADCGLAITTAVRIRDGTLSREVLRVRHAPYEQIST